jgi:uncharacterized protein YjbI with pentapeptide repeats
MLFDLVVQRPPGLAKHLHPTEYSYRHWDAPMANDEHVALLKKGVDAWNAWRRENPDIRPNLSGANLRGANLRGANLREADLREANLREANLSGANLSGADLFRADLERANLREADLSEAELSSANLRGANLRRANPWQARLREANLSEADLTRATLIGANLRRANLRRANLSEANIRRADLRKADLTRANLRDALLGRAHILDVSLTEADLRGASLEAAALVDTDLTGANLTGSHVYGISAWRLKLENAKQQNLVITRDDEPAITVDNIEAAQFIYLMLNNERVRDAIDTITSKVVLILGRFTSERKAVLDALREELRKRDYLPILFDFEVPARRNITETVTLLARMARFIIADLTDPSSIPQELQAIIPSVRVPVQPLLLEGSSLYSMFKDFDPQDFHWVLPVYRYKEPQQLLAMLAENVIAPAEGKAKALEERRRIFEAELIKPQ